MDAETIMPNVKRKRKHYEVDEENLDEKNSSERKSTLKRKRDIEIEKKSLLIEQSRKESTLSKESFEVTGIDSDKPRLRKKKLIHEVKELLEFYFSPANVSKDRFMRELLDQNQFIDIEIFHKFNKIKKLTSETEILKKAVSKSDILELSEDGLNVKRQKPMKFKEDETECTIYVENIPPSASHDWLKKVFLPYGTIDYISFPLFPKTGQPKGFSFIEFSSPMEAQKALEAFGGGLASLDGTLNPSELRSIQVYGQAEDAMPSKDLTCETTTFESLSQDASLKAKSTSDVDIQSTNSYGVLLKDKENDKCKPKKKKRKRNKKDKEYHVDQVYLRVLSKTEWKKLRNKYLNMQRENMKQLKHTIQKKQKEPFNYKLGRKFSNYNSDQSFGLHADKNEHPHASQYHEDAKVSKVASKPEFVASVIAKISLKSPPPDPKGFRLGLTSNQTGIAYVDISAENNDVFIRFKSPEALSSFLEKEIYENTSLLKGKEEEEYWQKLLTSWAEKRPKKNKNKDDKVPENVRTQNESKFQGKEFYRGRDKLMNKAIKFKEDSSLNTRIVFSD